MNGEPLHILLVEDNPDHAELVIRNMEDFKIGNKIFHVEDGEAALDYLFGRGTYADRTLFPLPTLMLLDLRLPKVDGLQVLKQVKENAELQALPVVILTTSAAERDMAMAYEYHANKAMFEAVSRGKREWEQTFDSVPDLISIIDTNHTIVRVNRAMAERCGLPPELIAGKKCYEVMHTLHLPPEFCPYSKMLLDKEVHHEVVEEKGTLNGIFDVTVSPLFNSAGEITSAVHVARDISERIQAERALIKSSELLRLALDASSDGIWDWDVPNGSIYWSPRCYTMLGYEPNEFPVTFKKWKELLHPSDSDEAAATIREMMNIADGNFSIEFRIATKDDSWRWIMWRGKPITRNEKGDILRFVGTNTDISERKQAEEERLKFEQQFQQTQKLESLGVLAGGIAHDFNNILSIILGHCYLSKESDQDESDQRERIEQIEMAANRAAELCRQMLAYAGKNPLVQDRLNMSAMVTDIVKMLQSAIKKNVTVELCLTDDVPEILGDTSQIQQIVMNLIINAAEAIGEANGTIRIALTSPRLTGERAEHDFLSREIPAGSYACLEVSDNGCGMNPDTQKRIFEPFYTTKFTGRGLGMSAGRGLGMSAILGIIKSHDGALQLASTPGIGTTFKTYFPLISDVVPVTTPTPSLEIAEMGSGCVLLVDDEETLRTIGAELLESMGFTVISATNGREALEIYRQRPSDIDILLLDLIMPEMGGIATYHEIRKISPDVPLIVCSGYGVEEVLDSIGNDPCAGFVQKPYRPGELQSVLTAFIHKSRAIRAAA
ncbi:MAG TPA: response regulator [Desulfuromonadales bacterium]|nr:response regulator [Desulfuromonadales bacterium]